MTTEAIEKLHLSQKLTQEEIDFAKEVGRVKWCYSGCLKAAMSNRGWKFDPTKGRFTLQREKNKESFIDIDILNGITNPQSGEVLIEAGFIDRRTWNLTQYAFLSIPSWDRVLGAIAAVLR